MHTLKKFIHYYGPYKAVFFLDLICATIISLIDLAYPQILRTCTNTLFTKRQFLYFKRTASHCSRSSDHIPDPEPVQIIMSAIRGHMMGAYMERDMRQQLFDHYEKAFLFYLLLIRTTPDR